MKSMFRSKIRPVFPVIDHQPILYPPQPELEFPLSEVKEWWMRDSCGHCEWTCCGNCWHFASKNPDTTKDYGFVEELAACKKCGCDVLSYDFSCPAFAPRLNRLQFIAFRVADQRFRPPKWAYKPAFNLRARMLLLSGKPFVGAPFDRRWRAYSSWDAENPEEAGFFSTQLLVRAKALPLEKSYEEWQERWRRNPNRFTLP